MTTKIRSTRGSAPQVLTMILAGGEGRRLYPLTADRAKPAVPFAGRYRIIDVVLSNFVNSGLQRIKVVTQYKSHSLETHIARVWRLSALLDNYIEAIPAQQRTGKTWFLGSADAVYQCMHVIADEHPDFVCVFGGDHVYKMDVRLMLDQHFERDAELTVAAIPVPREQASQFGVIEADADGRMVGFAEKPERPAPMPGNDQMSLVSMGNYVFNTDVLMQELTRDAERDASGHDFGADLIPSMVGRRRIFVYDFATNLVPGEPDSSRGYWRDIGTLDAYFAANLDLVGVSPQFNLYNPRWPIRSGYEHDPPAKFVFRDEASARVGFATDSLICEGCVVSGGRIHRSIVGPRVRINSFSEVEESILLSGVQVGRHAQVRRAIVDKDVQLPEGTRIGYDLEADRRRFVVSEGGIVVVPKRAKVESA